MQSREQSRAAAEKRLLLVPGVEGFPTEGCLKLGQICLNLLNSVCPTRGSFS